VVIRGWLPAVHKQIVADVAFKACPQPERQKQMAYEPKVLKGALFRNTDKPEGSNQPDYRGDIVVGGVKYRLSGWLKESARGKFLSISATRDEPTGETKRTRQNAPHRRRALAQEFEQYGQYRR
jgi:hypothetical protein